MKTRKFKIEFCVEVSEKFVKGLSEADAAQKVVTEVEETWDLGVAESGKSRKTVDSYGFEAALVD